MKSVYITFLILLLPSIVIAQEGGLKMPMTFEGAQVLPKGVRNVRFLHSQIDGVEKYSGGGSVVPVGDALNKSLTYADFIKGKDTVAEKAKLRGILSAYNISEDTPTGKTTGAVNIAIDAKVPVMAYGVSRKMTMALVIPSIRSKIDVDTGFVASNELSKFVQEKLQGQRNAQDKAFQTQYDTSRAIAKKLEDNGYKPLEESQEDRTRMGDISLVTKYLFNKGTDSLSALKVTITAPTGKMTDYNKAVDVGTGDGQWDFGLGYAYQKTVSDFLELSFFTGAIFQLPSYHEKRIPDESDSKITEDIDYNTYIDLGDHYQMQIAAKHSFWNGAFFTQGFTYQYKEADNYEGNDFAATRYNWLEQDTVQNMTTYQASLGFSTLPLFKQKKFKVPLQANLTYTSVINGMNVLKEDLYTFEMAIFF